MEEQFCPCCGRHCLLTNPSCERGILYANGESVSDVHREREHRHEQMRKTRYDTLDIDNKLICNIRDMGHTVRAMSDGKASQSRILIVLNTEGRMTQSKLTELLSVQPGTVSEVIGKLERAGLIERAENENDRRTSELRLTEEGVQQAMQASENRKNMYEDMFACLTESEKSDLLTLLEKVNKDWEQRYSFGRTVQHGEHHHGHHERSGRHRR